MKTNRSNLESFVTDNLANGVDHMVIFLEGGSPDARQFVGSHPQVTPVLEEVWWGDHRPAHLNTRQVINANAVNALLSDSGRTDWLFHIDSDEVLHLDLRELDQVDETTSVIRLPPLESVSQPTGPARPSYFKYALGEDELELLARLKIIARPTNASYFRGHLAGKSGFRPSLGIEAGIHFPRSRSADAVVAEVEAQTSRLLHFDCTNLADFALKWEAISSSGPPPAASHLRKTMLGAISTLYGMPISENVRWQMIRRLYTEKYEDDVAALLDLGLLVHVPRPQGETRTADRSGDNCRAQLTARLTRLAALPNKRVLATGSPQDIAAVL